MTKRDNNCPYCRRGNCLSQSKSKKRAKRVNQLAPVVTENTLKALQTITGYSVSELEHDHAKRELLLGYVRKACDAMQEINNTDCRLISSIFGSQQRAKYYGQEAGKTRQGLSHTLMPDPDLPTLFQGVVAHFPIWYNVFCEMLCKGFQQEDQKIQRSIRYARRWQRRMESLKEIPPEFKSAKPKWENLSFQNAIDETVGSAWSIAEAEQYPMDERLEHGGFRLIEFSKNGEPICSEISPHWGDPTRIGRKSGGIYRHFVTHNPMWAWESEMNGMFSCEFSPEEMHPKSLCQWHRWDSPQEELHAKQIEAEMEYIRTYKANVQPYAELRAQKPEEAEQSKYDILVLHLSPDAPTPLVVRTLPADQNLSPQERFASVNPLIIAQMFMDAGYSLSSVRLVDSAHIHGTRYESNVLKREAFVAHITLAGSRYSWATDGTKELIWSKSIPSELK